MPIRRRQPNRHSGCSPDKPSIAVLSFPDDADRNTLPTAHRLDIITELWRVPAVTCSSSRATSTFTYKGKAIDAGQVARELGVHYVLEGSVRKAGNRVGVTGS